MTNLTATLHYLKPTPQKPVYRASAAGVGDDHNIGIEFDERAVAIADARRLQPPPTLDREGFALFQQPTTVRDFHRLQDQRGDYEREIVQRVLAVTGAGEACVFDHTVRADCARIRGLRGSREPAGFVHNDYTDNSARRRLEQVLSTRGGQGHPRRYAIINVWRSIHGVVHNSPVACCDARTLSKDDLVAVERRAPDRTGELEFVTFNPAHRWYYYPAMTEDEVLLFKTFDSAADGTATRAIHSAFENPLAPPDAAPRESIESRLLVLFD